MRKITLLALLPLSVWAQTTLVSPEGHNRITLTQQNDEFCYTVTRDDKPIVTDSRLGLDLDNRTWERALARKYPQYKCWMNGFTVDSVSQSEQRSVVHNLWGEQATAPDNYNAATVYLSKHDGSDYRLNIELRAYDEGIAFRYFFPEHPMAVFHKVVADLTEYTFAPGTKVWAAEWAQAP